MKVDTRTFNRRNIETASHSIVENSHKCDETNACDCYNSLKMYF